MQHAGFYQCVPEVFTKGGKANRQGGVSHDLQSSEDTVQNCSERVEEIIHLVSRIVEILHSNLDLWGFMDRETLF